MLRNVAFNFVPSVVAPTTITIATTAAIRPYSSAVTPRLSLFKPNQVFTIFVMMFPFTTGRPTCRPPREAAPSFGLVW